MTGKQSLRGELIWSVLGTGLLAVSGYVVLVSVAKLAGTAALGRYGLAVAIAAPAFVLSNMSMRSLYVTDPAGEHPFGQYLAFRVLATTLTALLLAGGWMLFESGLQQRTIGILVVGTTAIDAVRDLLAGVFQRHDRVHAMGQSLALRGFTRAVLVPSAMLATDSVEVGLVFDVVSALAVMVLFDIRLIARWRLETTLRPAHLTWAGGRELMQRALPLSLALVLVMLQGHMPRVIIEDELGAIVLGFWVALDGTSRLPAPVYAAMSSVMLPKLARAGSEFGRVLRGFLLGCVLLGAVTVGAFTLLGGWALGLLFERSHEANAGVLVIVAGASAFQQVGNVFGVGLTARRHFYAALAPQLATTLLLAPVLFYVVPRHGLAGAATVLLVHHVVLAVLFGVITWTVSSRSKETRS